MVWTQVHGQGGKKQPGDFDTCTSSLKIPPNSTWSTWQKPGISVVKEELGSG